jgi:transposase
MALLFEGRSYREITAIAGCSHRDVSQASKTIKEKGLTARAVSAMSDEDLRALFPDGRSKVSDRYDAPDFARVAKSMKANRHYTLSQAWRRYTGSASALRKYGYAQYCHLFSEYARRNDLVAVLRHEPGRAAFVDWAGDTVPLADAVTGEKSRAYLFVAALPFSGLVFCGAYTDMKMENWIDAHVRMFEFFGGVPQIIVPDNASTATHRKVKGDPARFVSERYRQMADHYGTAVVPARVKKARDKAAVESAVNVANMRVLGYLLEEEWADVAELREAVGERVEEINREIRRADGTTRQERFDAEEASRLGPLPADRFEEVDWREAKAQRNYHVTCDSQHYSVPWRLAGRMVRVRLTATTVTVFDGSDLVASHRRAQGRKGQYSTDLAHVPPQHRNIAGLWSKDWFLDRAKSFGPATVDVVRQILERQKIEAQGYLDCQNILGTLGRKNHARLEAACQQLLNMRGFATYSTLKRLIAGIGSDADKPAASAPAASNRKPAAQAGPGQADVSVRGSDYYRTGR